MKDRNETPPSRVPLVAYCPEWSNNGFQVCEFTGARFVYEGQPNEDFDQYVEKWAEVPNPQEITSGDAVTCRACFGEQPLIFVGVFEPERGDNNAAVLYNNGELVPVRFEHLEAIL